MHVAVLGQGFVGLPLSVAMASAGHEVSAVDVDRGRFRSLTECRSYVGDVEDADLRRESAAGRFVPTASLDAVPAADAYVIAVPTSLAPDRTPDLEALDTAVADVAAHARRGALVVVESTIYPGAMRSHVAPLFARLSGLEPGVDVHLAYSPDRVDPGRGWRIEEIPKLVAGVDEESDAIAAKFYESVFEQVVRVPGCEVAEFAKLLENTYRYLNIAFVNEMCRASHAIGVDFREVVSAASSKPFGFMAFHPGPGVGGHCLPYNVHYLNHVLAGAGHPSGLLERAVGVNESMPAYAVARLAAALDRGGGVLRGSTVLLLGLSFKGGVPDSRNSPTYRVAALLAAEGATVRVADPVAGDPAEPASFVVVEPSGAECRSADAVMLLTDHDQIDYDDLLDGAKIVLDCRGKLRDKDIEQL